MMSSAVNGTNSSSDPGMRQIATWWSTPRTFEVRTSDTWSLVTVAGLGALILLWGWQLYATWGVWGNLTIDSGHEMYVPALLAEGKTLYRDVWFMYTPAAPYFNSYLFRLFGVHLNVLYWAGSLSALSAAIFLYLTGMRLSAWLVGWAAGAVVILEAFDSSLFSFPLPYSFAAVYGCVVACAFVWVLVIAARSGSWGWMFTAGTLAAAALLLKPEFGTAAYGTLALLIAVRAIQTSARSLWRDVSAMLPGIAISVLVIYWMVSIAGVSFITQENIMSWPTSYFMKTYGQQWLERIGFAVNATAIWVSVALALFPAGVVMELYCILKWKRWDTISVIARLALFLAVLAYAIGFLNLTPRDMVAALIFPKLMVLYVAVAAAGAWWYFWRQPAADRDLSVPLLFTFASLLAFRILLKMGSWGYPIYYNGPVILCYWLLASAVFAGLAGGNRLAFLGEVLICVVGVSGIAYAVGHFVPARGVVPLITARGTVRVAPRLAEGYEAAIAFMKDKAAQGEYVLSVPEDTSLYFLSGTYCPTRVYLFSPGVLAPGKMTDETIQEIERKRVRYLLWSNRTFEEYGTPVFGTDFNREFGEYLTSHYRRIGQVTPDYSWRVDAWERRPEAAFQ
jgi:hypothetical protein